MAAHMWQELSTQGDAWASAVDEVTTKRSELERLLDRARGKEVRFLGAGSSYYLGLTASLSWSRGGWMTRVLPPSEQLLHPSAYQTEVAPLVIAVSRSGTTTETVKALEMLKAQGSSTIAITTKPESMINDIADLTITVIGGAEQCTVQTRSFSGQLVAAQALAFLANSDPGSLSELGRLKSLSGSWLEKSDRVVHALQQTFERVYFLGSGERWGLALEGALKMKETTLTESEGFHFLEFRHGPQSMADDRTLIVGLLGQAGRDAEVAVLREMAQLGAQVLAIGEDTELYRRDFTTLSFASGLTEGTRSALYLPPLHLLAYYRAQHKGLDPDQPRHLSFAVQLERI